MRIRLTGTRAETSCAADIRLLLEKAAGEAHYRVGEPSSFYPNRRDSRVGRRYLDVHVEIQGGDRR